MSNSEVELTFAPPTFTTEAEVAEIARVQRLAPTEDDVKGKPGYSRTYREDGSYEWHYTHEQNDSHGKLTSAGHEAQEMMQPFLEANTERMAARSVATPAVAMRDADGRTQFVRPEMADGVARRNGWRHKVVVRGRRSAVAMADGTYLSRSGQRWQVEALTGNRILEGKLLVAPDGVAWRFIDGQYREVG